MRVSFSGVLVMAACPHIVAQIQLMQLCARELYLALPQSSAWYAKAAARPCEHQEGGACYTFGCCVWAPAGRHHCRQDLHAQQAVSCCLWVVLGHDSLDAQLRHVGCPSKHKARALWRWTLKLAACVQTTMSFAGVLSCTSANGRKAADAEAFQA